MKPLYFTACSHPRVAPALSTQAHESLRPYTAYLKSEITAAVRREARSVCGWEPVPTEYPIKLAPADSLVVVESSGVTYELSGWTGELPDMPLFVGAQYRPVSPARVEQSGELVRITLEQELEDGDQVFWAGRPCSLRRAD